MIDRIKWDAEFLYTDGVRQYATRKLLNIAVMSDYHQLDCLVCKLADGTIQPLLQNIRVTHFSAFWITIQGFEVGSDGKSWYKQVMTLRPSVVENTEVVLAKEPSENKATSGLSNQIATILGNHQSLDQQVQLDQWRPY